MVHTEIEEGNSVRIDSVRTEEETPVRSLFSDGREVAFLPYTVGAREYKVGVSAD